MVSGFGPGFRVSGLRIRDSGFWFPHSGFGCRFWAGGGGKPHISRAGLWLGVYWGSLGLIGFNRGLIGIRVPDFGFWGEPMYKALAVRCLPKDGFRGLLGFIWKIIGF